MWIRAGACGLVVLALLAVTGVAPGDSTRATVDHCYSYNGDWIVGTKCTGHWTRFGHTFTGPVHGVNVADNWQAIPPAPRADGWDEVTVPESARDHAALTVPGGALVTPGWVWAARVVLVAALAVLVLLLARLAGLRRRVRAS